MNYQTFFETIHGVKFKRIKRVNATLMSVSGSAHAVIDALGAQLPTGYIRAEQLVHFGISPEGGTAHLVFLEDAKTTLQEEETVCAMLDDFSYLHLVAQMKHGVRIGLFDRGFLPNPATSAVFAGFCDAVFEDGKAIGRNTNTLLMVGKDTKDCVLVARDSSTMSPIRLILSPFKGDVCYTTSQDNTVLAIVRGSGQTAALHVDNLIGFLKQCAPFEWKPYTVPGVRIEDASISIGSQPTVLLTAMIQEERYLVAANPLWFDGNGWFCLLLARRWSIRLHEGIPAILNVDVPKRLVASMGRNGDGRYLEVTGFADQDSAFETIVMAADSGAILAATM